ncbi:tetratricopeptide repeat protein [Streptomyces sp. YIM 132580]|uniref:tetratricopeptide repeat protein n=1 Tax=Streptomyces sp. YIM 132580 TaxID=2691958 RepID=UPI001F361D80
MEIYRRLAKDNIAAHEPDLARSLSNLGGFLSEVRRPADALPPTEQAVEIRRRLAKDNPAAHEPELATSLSVWASVRFGEQHDLSGALQATSEAVEIYRRLISVRPDDLHFLSPLRAVLSLQVRVLLSLGRLQDAQTIRDWLALNPGQPASQN